MESLPVPESAPAARSFHQLLLESAPGYLERFGEAMPARLRQVLQQILRCRTPALGGQLFGCPECQRFRYTLCNNAPAP